MGLFDGFVPGDKVQMKPELRQVYGKKIYKIGKLSAIKIDSSPPETTNEILTVFNPGGIPITQFGIYKVGLVTIGEGESIEIELRFLEKVPPQTKQSFHDD